MDYSIFVYGQTVGEDAFTDRKEESQKLYSNLMQGVNTTIISPRRWGKSSLVEKVFKDIAKNEKKVKTVLIDLFFVASEEEFLELFSAEVIKASSSKVEDWISSTKELFKNLIPKISLGVDPMNDFSLSFDWADLMKHKEEVLNLPEVIAKEKNIRFIIALDEFQNLASFPEYISLEKKMRAVWQRQKRVSYCLYGSKRHMMTDIFNNASKPFYRFGDMMLLQKIDTEHWVKFIQKNFKKSGKKIAKKLALKIPSLMGNHPWYVQQYSHYIWQKTNMQVEMSQLESALMELIYANTPFFQKEIESLSATQLSLLKAVASNENQLTSARVMQSYRLGTPRNVIKNKTILINNDVIDFDGKNYEFLDPVFELWFLRQYLKIDYFTKLK
ncbi:MAG: ATP-binding protein [Bacteroidales bacterium]|nr:ATP-binding protein [Bacteroidales bacterium]